MQISFRCRHYQYGPGNVPNTVLGMLKKVDVAFYWCGIDQSIKPR